MKKINKNKKASFKLKKRSNVEEIQTHNDIFVLRKKLYTFSTIGIHNFENNCVSDDWFCKSNLQTFNWVTDLGLWF